MTLRQAKTPLHMTLAFMLVALVFSALPACDGCSSDDDAEATEASTAGSATTKSSGTSDQKPTATTQSEREEARRNARRERMSKAREERVSKAKAAKEKRAEAINTAASKESGREKVSAEKPTGANEKRAADVNTAASKESGRERVNAKKRTATPADRNQPATARMMPTRTAMPTVDALNIDRLLPLAHIKQLVGKKRLTSLGALQGMVPTAAYNSRYVAGPKRSQFGVSIQVWKEVMTRDMNERFTRMRRDYSNVVNTSAVMPKGFFSYWNDIMTLVFMDYQKKLIVAIACGQSFCNQEQLLDLAMKAKSQL